GEREAGGIACEIGGRRFYAIQVAEKGYEVFRIHVAGTWGHGSMPRDDNAAVLAAEAVTRLAPPGEPRLTPAVRRLLDEVGAALPSEQRRLVEAVVDEDPKRADAALPAASHPPHPPLLPPIVP